MKIITPASSFVRLSDNHQGDADWFDRQIPGSAIGFGLPVCAPDDFSFQFIVDCASSSDADTICAVLLSDIRMKLVVGSGLGPNLNESTILADTGYLDLTGVEENADDLGFEKYRLNDTQVLFYVPKLRAHPFAFYDLNPGVCFQIAINFYGTGASPVGVAAVSNVFWYRDDPDFSTVLEYDSEQDEAGIIYCVSPSIRSRARLPLYLTRPAYAEDESILRDSKGNATITASKVRKQFEVVTDLLPVWATEALRAVFLHDNITVDVASTVPQTLIYKGDIVKDGAYEIEYVDYKNYPLATAKFKVAATPYALQKNNCGECVDYSFLIGTTDSTLPAVAVGATYVVDLTTLVDASCCSPVSYQIVYTNPNYLQSGLLVGAALGAGGGPITDLTIYMRSGSFISLFPTNPLVTVAVSCGGVTKNVNILQP